MDLFMYITGTRRGLGKYLSERWNTVDTLEECDVFINCKDENQVKLLHEAAQLNKRIINIGSNAADWQCVHPEFYLYSINKMSLDNANQVLFYQGVNTTIIRPGWIDTERVSHIDEKKMSKQYIAEVIEWILDQPHRIKDITLCP